jgi:ferrous iron transport protein A
MPRNATRNFFARFRKSASAEQGRAATGRPAVAGTTTHLHFDQRARHTRMTDHPRMTLADLGRGATATITSIAGTTAAKLHLMEMGLTPGTSVKVIRVAVFGGPLDISVRGYRLSLRREEARAIQLHSS